MELNREEIIKACEICFDTTTESCKGCPFLTNCKQDSLKNLALILIKELTDERDIFREYAYHMQRYVESIKHKEEEGYEPSAARYAAEMDMWRMITLRENQLVEEMEELKVQLLSMRRNQYDEGFTEGVLAFETYLKEQSFNCDPGNGHSFDAIDVDELDDYVKRFLEVEDDE